MKIRHDFVTNSSSSSFILSFANKEDGLAKIDGLKQRYGSIFVDCLKEDFEKAEPIALEDLYEEVELDLKGDAGYYLNLGEGGWWSADKPTFQKKWEDAHPNATHRDYYNSPERKAAVEDYMKSRYEKMLKDIGDNKYLVEMEYEDHTDIGSELEHDILPNCDFVVKRFNHH